METGKNAHGVFGIDHHEALSDKDIGIYKMSTWTGSKNELRLFSDLGVGTNQEGWDLRCRMGGQAGCSFLASAVVRLRVWLGGRMGE